MSHNSLVKAWVKFINRYFEINESALCLRDFRVPLLTNLFYYGYQSIDRTPF